MLKVVLLLAFTAQCVLAGCPSGWEEFDDFCYGFSDESLNWYLAAAMCDVYCARLVQIENETKHNWLVNQLKARKFGETWIGGSKRHSGIWQWIPGCKPINAYTNWGPGEPNGATTELCLNLYPGHDYKWNDANCSRELRFVCQKRVKNCIN